MSKPTNDFDNFVEALTEREQEILACLKEGLSNQAIADQLHLALKTVKWYNSQIYAKLGVKGRKSAVERAEALGLLDDSTASTPHHLPTQTTPFIGRTTELNDLTELITDEAVRLITILAPGGMGKTRLAIEVGHHQRKQFQDDVYFVPLATISDPSNLITLLAEQLNFPFQQDTRSPEQQILDYLKRKQMLLIFDNFEHVLARADVVTNILKVAPQVKIIITSRERLAVSGETVYRIGGLDLPDADISIDSDAVQLFLQQASRTKQDFVLQDEDEQILSHICQLTDGMPLALILAGAWVDVLSLQEIADEIQQSFDFLAVEMRDVAQRQWSIRAVFDPTWKRLTDQERTIFMKFAVFRGGCTREAAHAVTGATLRHLQTFVNKALLTRIPDGRYEIHELLRQYIEGHLETTQEIVAVHQAHSQYYLQMLAEREADLKGRRQSQAFNDFDSDFENIRLAWQWAVQQENHEAIADALETLVWFCMLYYRFLEGDALLVEAFDKLSLKFLHLGNRIFASRVLLERFGTSSVSDPEDKSPHVKTSLSEARQAGNRSETAFYLFVMGAIATRGYRNNEMSLAYYDEALTIYRELGDNFYIAWSLLFMGMINTQELDRQNIGEVNLREASDLQQQIGDDIGLAISLLNLHIKSFFFDGNISESKQHLEECIVVMQRLRQYRYYRMLTVPNQAIYSLLKGDFEVAIALAQEGVQLAIDFNNDLPKTFSLATLALIACIQDDLLLAKDLISEAQSFSVHDFADANTNWTSAFAYCAIGDYDSAIRYTQRLLNYLIATNCPVLLSVQILIPSAMILAHQQSYHQAVELLALADSYSPDLVGWTYHWQALQQLKDQLKQEIGQEAYQEAWQHGQTLSLKETIQHLATQFGRSQ